MPDTFHLVGGVNLILVIFFFLLQLLYRWTTFGSVDAIITYLNAANFAQAIALVARISTEQPTPATLSFVPFWVFLILPLILLLFMAFQLAVHSNEKKRQDRSLERYILAKQAGSVTKEQEDAITHLGKVSLPLDFNPESWGGRLSGNEQIRKAYLDVVKQFGVVPDMDPDKDYLAILPEDRNTVIWVYQLFAGLSVCMSVFLIALSILDLVVS